MTADEFSYSHLAGLRLGAGALAGLAAKPPGVLEAARCSLVLTAYGGCVFDWAAPVYWDVVAREPHAFLRGLLAANGSRVVNRFTTTLPSGRVAEYAYPRWFFSNADATVRSAFCEACDRVDVRWTASSRRNLSVAHRASVALLDELAYC